MKNKPKIVALFTEGEMPSETEEEEGGSCQSFSPSKFLEILRKDAQAYLDPQSFSEFEVELKQQALAIQIGAALVGHRKRNGLSAARVAISAGLSRTALHDLESGVSKRGPRISSLQKYLRGIDGSMSMMLRTHDGDAKILIQSTEAPELASSRIIEQIRHISGLTQIDIEKRISSPGGFLSRIENQRGGSICLGTISKVANACEVSISNIEVLENDTAAGF